MLIKTYPASLHTIFCVYASVRIGGLKNEAQQNVKPDHIRTVPRYHIKLRN